jgi:RNA polymerase sigma factor (sigma-70 family)
MSSLEYGMQNTSDEQRLVKQCLLQNSTAQKILYEKYFPMMMAVCLRYLKNEEDAWEVLNNAFLKVFSKLNQYKSQGTLDAWLRKVVVNTCLDFIKGNKSYRKKFILTDEFQQVSSIEESENESTDLTDAEMFLSSEEIFELITELPPVSRIVFNLYVVDDFSHKKIAEHLNISEGTSKWHLSNARKMMRIKIHLAVSKKNNNVHGSKR